MKKVILTLLFLGVMFSNCSGDSDSSGLLPTNGTRLKKSVIKDENGVVFMTQEYQYLGERLTKIVYSNNSYVNFFL